MATILQQLLAGPTYTALSGERRKAFVRQWIISGVIFVIGVVLALTVQQNVAIGVFVSLLLLQTAYAFVRGETIWQLRISQLRSGGAQKRSNKAELLVYAEQLKKGHK